MRRSDANPNLLHRTRRRRGAATIVLIAVFVVVMSISGLWTRRIVQDRRLQTLREARVQARWLADAGVHRAIARLHGDADYVGETWSVQAPTSRTINPVETDDVRVEIEVVSAASDNSDKLVGERKIVATARIPNGKEPRVQFTKTVQITLVSTKAE